VVQKYKPKKIFPKKKRKIDVFIIDEISIKVGYEYVWLWGIIEPKDKEIIFHMKSRPSCFQILS
jgi:transposase-like protein